MSGKTTKTTATTTTTNRTRPDLKIEKQYQGIIAGIDEVGRGPWAGPVVACSLTFLKQNLPLDLKKVINDSKKLTEKARLKAYNILVDTPDLCHWAVGEASVEEVDELNIHQATLLAMKRSLLSLNLKVDIALVDGRFVPQVPCQAIPVIQGDSKSVSIAAASIIAKVHRDRYMTELSQHYPQYGWNTNAGYGTTVHQEALKVYGPTPHHRKSFAPIRNLLEGAYS